jgi:hypothetical protein
MTATFTSLPLEVRNQIYEHLFDKPICEPPQDQQYLTARTEGNNLSDVSNTTEWLSAIIDEEFSLKRWSPQSLPASEGLREVREHEFIAILLPYRSLSGGPAILRTCRQVYHEAISFLYANPVFECHSLWLSQYIPSRYKICDFSDQGLQRIQQCNIVVGLCVPLAHIMDSIAYFTNNECLLKRLGVTFNFNSTRLTGFENDAEVRYHEWVLAISHCSKIVESIAAVRVLQNIDIVVTDSRNEYENTPGDIFEPFVEAIATAKGWFCTERVCESTICDESRHSVREWDDHEWIWHWQLRPLLNKPA